MPDFVPFLLDFSKAPYQAIRTSMAASRPSPLFDWLDHRATGVLCHPTSFPGSSGIGTLGASARQFVDFLSNADIRYWQTLPVGPTGFGDSPYAAFSAFAGNPYFIDLDALMEFGLLKRPELKPLEILPHDRVDFGALYQTKWPVLRLAWRRFRERNLAYLANYGLFADFKKENADWLLPYARYMALKQHFGGKAWTDWPTEYRTAAALSKSSLPEDTEDLVESHCFYQYLFFGQWQLLRTYARSKNIELIGDIPIFVALDSADVWAHPELFLLGKDGLPSAVAGVPPDYFSETGQLWGNPLYDWKASKSTQHKWWIERLKMCFRLFDVVRLDHFRGFHSYWEIPAKAKDAREGKWVDGPGLEFFKTVKAALPNARIIAEDLGIIPLEVRDFLAQTGLPGMAILHFAFDGADTKNLYLPHNIQRNTVVYPGTHDNSTTVGWYESATDATRDHVRRYFRISGHEISWDLIRATYASSSNLGIIALQDFLSLGADARMNAPGTAQGNWQWRYSPEQLAKLEKESTAYLKELAWLYGRNDVAATPDKIEKA